MDTHVTAAPELDRIGTPLRPPIGLPGELGASTGPGGGRRDAPDEAPVPPPAPAVSAGQPVPRKRSRRKGLLLTAAFGAVLVGVGGAGWWYRQDLTALDLRHLEAPAFLHRWAGLAAQPPAEVGVESGAVPVTQARRAAPAPAVPRPQASEFASLQSLPGSLPAEVGVSAPSQSPAITPRDPVPSSPASTEVPPAPPPAPAAQPVLSADSVAGVPPAPPAPVAPPVPSNGPVIGAAVATDAAPAPSPAAGTSAAPPPAASADTSVAVSAPAQQPPAAPPVNAPAPASAVSSAPPVRDPVAAAGELRAAPLSLPEQIKVVDLVKELGAQLRDTRTEVAQLRATVAQLVETVETKTTQFESRLSLAEAGTVLAQSARAGNPEASAPAPSSPPTFRVASAGRAVPLPMAATTSPAASPPRTVKDYRIQGASPGLAVLSVLNSPPGGQTVIEVAIGSEVPGVGRIKAIFQRGTAWVVQTDAGAIQ